MQRVRQITGSLLVGLCALLGPLPAHAQAGTWSDRAFLDVNAGKQLTGKPFEEHLAPIIYSERGSITVPHLGNARWTTIDFGGGVRVWKSVGAGATYTRLGYTEDVTVAALVPNPVLFNQTRAASKLTPLQRNETALHLHGLYVIPVTPRIDVMVAGGPSLISLSQDLVSGLELSEGAEPYVTVAVGNVQTVTRTERILGFNGSAGVTYFVTPLVGVGGTIRYSSGSVAMEQADGRSIDLSRAGFQVSFGARVRFR
jgi:hypothetical protein